MLYMWHSGMVEGGLGQVFSPELGEFRSMSFVLEHEYMFVQVNILIVYCTVCLVA